MKLVRLITDNDRAIFNNTFNADLVLKENAKIALQSLSIDTENTVLVVDGANDTIDYQITTNITKTIKLDHDVFSRLNFQDLFDDIRLKLNANSGFVPAPSPDEDRRELGIEWRCETNQAKKVSIEYHHGTNAEHIDDWNYDNTKVERVTSNNRQVWRQKAGQPQDTANERSVIFNNFVCRGCGIVRCRTNKFNNETLAPQSNGYIIGFSKNNISAKEPKDLTNADLSYGIAVATDVGGTKRYYRVEDGVYTQIVGINPSYLGESNVGNDFQEVIKNFNTIQLNIYQQATGSAPQLAHEFDFPNSDVKLYPFIVFRGGNADLNNLRTTPTPFAPNFTYTTLGDFSPDRLGAPPVPQRNPSNNFLQLAPSVADFLGYENPRQPQIGFHNVVAYNYIADRVFDPVDISDAFLVEMLNLKLESYDGLQEQRKNILAVIPQSNKEGEIIFETNTPIFIDINNAKPLLLRNLSCRVVKPDYSELKMLGQATLVLLIDG
jgi:hypothetical protein